MFEIGHLICREGNVLMKQFEIEAILGQGGFGKVYKVRNLKNNQVIALKIIKNKVSYLKHAKREIFNLKILSEKDPNNKQLCVKLLGWFYHMDHVCISLNLLGPSVRDFIDDVENSTISLNHVRLIGYQLCHATNFLHHNSLIS